MVKDNFLSKQQKEVKGKIMNELLSAIHNNIRFNKDLFDDQAALDLIGSIVVMFNREILSSIFVSLEKSDRIDRNELMDEIFDCVKSEVNLNLNMKMN